ncbi:MAG TPA: hypothetical protein VN950_25500 [Terriglobales bacterium]|nr:hypothetical protein [Terriglobales bacterium]
MPEVGFPELIKRLDAVIGLLVVTLPQPKNSRSSREQIKLLNAAGLDPADIAKIVGKPRTAVNSELAKIRAGKKKRRRKVTD